MTLFFFTKLCLSRTITKQHEHGSHYLYTSHLSIIFSYTFLKIYILCEYTVPLNLPENTHEHGYFRVWTVSGFVSTGSLNINKQSTINLFLTSTF